LAALRSKNPVAWVESLGGWLVTDRATALAVMRDFSTFTVDDPRFSTTQVMGISMLSVDGAQHGRHREPFVESFKSSAVGPHFGEWIAVEARRLVESFKPHGTAELRSALAAPLAVATIIEVLGLVDAEVDEVLAWYRFIGEAIEGINAGRAVDASAQQSLAQLRHHIDEAVQNGNSLLGQAVTTLTEEEIFANAAVMMFGAIETSEGTTAGTLLHLLQHPEQLDQVQNDRSLVSAAIDETLRLEPSVTLVDRYATTATELSGVAIAEGDLVSVSLAAANRDPAVFDLPDQFDIHRHNLRQHVTFVQGPHRCLGMHLARLETQIALNAVLDHLPGLVFDQQNSTPARGLVFRKPVAVTALWESSTKLP
jgi:cytochrome P450